MQQAKTFITVLKMESCLFCIKPYEFSRHMKYTEYRRWVGRWGVMEPVSEVGTKNPWFWPPFFKALGNKANLRDLIAATGLYNLEILWLTFKNIRAPPLCYVKLCASFQSHRSIQTGVTIRKCSIRVKISDFLSCVTLKFDGGPWKTIEHLFYAMLSFVQYFKAIGEFKLESQSRNIQLESKSVIFFVQCDLEIWWRTLKNNRAPLLCYFKLCASFPGHWWIQTGVTVQKLPIWVKIADLFSRVTLEFDGWPCKTKRHLS